MKNFFTNKAEKKARKLAASTTTKAIERFADDPVKALNQVAGTAETAAQFAANHPRITNAIVSRIEKSMQSTSSFNSNSATSRIAIAATEGAKTAAVEKFCEYMFEEPKSRKPTEHKKDKKSKKEKTRTEPEPTAASRITSPALLQVGGNIIAEINDNLRSFPNCPATLNIPKLFRKLESTDMQCEYLVKSFDLIIKAYFDTEKSLPKNMSKNAKDDLNTLVNQLLTQINRTTYNQLKGKNVVKVGPFPIQEPHQNGSPPRAISILLDAQAEDCKQCFIATLDFLAKSKVCKITDIHQSNGLSILGSFLIDKDIVNNTEQRQSFLPYLKLLAKHNLQLQAGDIECFIRDQDKINKFHNTDDFLQDLENYAKEIETQYNIQILSQGAKMAIGLHQASKDWQQTTDIIQEEFAVGVGEFSKGIQVFSDAVVSFFSSTTTATDPRTERPSVISSSKEASSTSDEFTPSIVIPPAPKGPSRK